MADDAVVERRRALLEAAPALLRGEFRLFFVGGTAWAVIALLLWLRAFAGVAELRTAFDRSEEHTSELQSLMRISYAVFCLNKKHINHIATNCSTLNAIN